MNVEISNKTCMDDRDVKHNPIANDDERTMRVFTMAETSMSSEWDREWDDGELNVTSLGSMTWGYCERGNASVMKCKVCRVQGMI